ncbi:hypothetical protein ZWY2020_001399 [Hordeum vulgare]|nr:hypothetical protein ZWY2020_001399 [Hordeum vulgare]
MIPAELGSPPTVNPRHHQHPKLSHRRRRHHHQSRASWLRKAQEEERKREFWGQRRALPLPQRKTKRERKQGRKASPDRQHRDPSIHPSTRRAVAHPHTHLWKRRSLQTEDERVRTKRSVPPSLQSPSGAAAAGAAAQIPPDCS